MNQKMKNHDSIVQSEFYHYSQQNYCNMIVLFLHAEFAMLLCTKMLSAPVTDLAACLTRNSWLLHRGDYAVKLTRLKLLVIIVIAIIILKL